MAQTDKPDAAQTGLLPRPLEGRYDVSVTVAIVALAPFIVISTAYVMFSRQVQADLDLSRFNTQLISGLSIAGYAFGALLGGDVVQCFRQRRLFFLCEALFVIGCTVAAAAHGVFAYGFGRILSGLATGLLMVIALPPIIQRFPAAKLRVTVVWVNLGFFGAVCLGPLLGGAIAAGHAWRWFYAALGIIGLINLGAPLFTLPRYDPPDPDLRFDAWALVLGFAAVVLPFVATGELAAHAFGSLRFMLPLSIGLACFAALLMTEYHKKEPLSPVKLLADYIIAPIIAKIAQVGSLKPPLDWPRRA